MYFCPAALTVLTQRFGVELGRIESGRSFSYSLIGILSCSMTHSPLPRSEETPQ